MCTSQIEQRQGERGRQHAFSTYAILLSLSSLPRLLSIIPDVQWRLLLGSGCEEVEELRVELRLKLLQSPPVLLTQRSPNTLTLHSRSGVPLAGRDLDEGVVLHVMHVVAAKRRGLLLEEAGRLGRTGTHLRLLLGDRVDLDAFLVLVSIAASRTELLSACGPRGSCLALQILLLGVMKTSRLSDTSECLGRGWVSFLAFMENSRQLSSMSSGGAGSMADSFLRSVEAAFRLMLCYDSLILFTTLDDCILQSASLPRGQMDQQTRLFISKKANSTYVVLENCMIGDEGLALLTESDFPSKNLWLATNNISPEGVKHFQGRQWDDLLFLSLHNNHIGNIGCKFLTRTAFTALRNIDISKNQIESAGVGHLAKAEWPCLRYISLIGNRGGEGAVRSLAKGNWPRLEQLYLIGNGIDPSELVIVTTYIFNLKSFLYDATPNKTLENFFSRKMKQGGVL